MELFANTKTLNYFDNIPLTEGDTKTNFNQWIMMVTKAKRRNLMVLMHGQTKYVIVVYGFLKPKNIEDFIYNIMREFYESKGIAPEVIEKLLVVGELSLIESPSHSLTTSLYKRYENIKDLLNMLDETQKIQYTIMDEINWYEGNRYHLRSPESLFINIENNYQDTYNVGHAIELHTELLLDNYRVTRNFLVNADMTLYDLHRLLQIGYQYTDTYNHSFFTLDNHGIILDEISNHVEHDGFTYTLYKGLENEMTVEDIIEDNSQFLYVYNFSSEWQILINASHSHRNVEMRLPTCLHSSSEAPHEALASEEDYDFLNLFFDQVMHPVIRQQIEPKATYDSTSINQLIEKEMYR